MGKRGSSTLRAWLTASRAVSRVGCRKIRFHQREHGRRVQLGHCAGHVAQEVHLAALPGRADEHLRQGAAQPLMGAALGLRVRLAMHVYGAWAVVGAAVAAPLCVALAALLVGVPANTLPLPDAARPMPGAIASSVTTTDAHAGD